MIVAEVPEWLATAGGAAGALAAIIGLLALVGRSKLGRWLWAKLVHDPATAWLRSNIKEEVAPVADRVDLLAGRVDEVSEQVGGVAAGLEDVGGALVTHMADELADRRAEAEDRRQAQAENRLWRQSVERQLSDGAREFGELRGNVARLDEKLDAALAGNPEVRR